MSDDEEEDVIRWPDEGSAFTEPPEEEIEDKELEEAEAEEDDKQRAKRSLLEALFDGGETLLDGGEEELDLGGWWQLEEPGGGGKAHGRDGRGGLVDSWSARRWSNSVMTGCGVAGSASSFSCSTGAPPGQSSTG